MLQGEMNKERNGKREREKEEMRFMTLGNMDASGSSYRSGGRLRGGGEIFK